MRKNLVHFRPISVDQVIRQLGKHFSQCRDSMIMTVVHILTTNQDYYVKFRV